MRKQENKIYNATLEDKITSDLQQWIFFCFGQSFIGYKKQKF